MKENKINFNKLIRYIVLVLVFIIVSFYFINYSSKIGFDDNFKNSNTGCYLENPAINSLGYVKVEYLNSCNDKENFVEIIGVNKKENKVCCGIK